MVIFVTGVWNGRSHHKCLEKDVRGVITWYLAAAMYVVIVLRKFVIQVIKMPKLSVLPGIGADTEKTLARKGIEDVSDLLVVSPARLGEMTGMNNDDIDKLFRKAREYLEKQGTIGVKLINGLEAAKQDESRLQIPTGSNAMDKLFGGGIEIGETTEIFGEFGCGKTQFCHTMCVMTQKHFPGSKCMWLDSEKTFIADRIKTIARANNLDPDDCLENIIVARAHNSNDQVVILEEIQRYLRDDDSVKLIVIDSATGLFRSDYSGRGNLSERQRIMGEFLNLASKIASYYNTAMLWTNQVMISPGIMYGDPVLAVGGTRLAHMSTHRVYFKKAGKKRIGKMVDSPRYPQTEVTFGLHENGIVDPELLEDEEKAKKASIAKEKREAKKQLKKGIMENQL